MWELGYIFLSLCHIALVHNPICDAVKISGVLSKETFVFWPNGTVPFYINPKHFGTVTLFIKEMNLPFEWQLLPYDVNSVMHFGERDYSKNGHRTVIIKDHRVKQNRIGLTSQDIRKIEIIYGPECQRRDRQEKIELCQNYPGVARKKRDVEENRSLRVNPNITPPPDMVDDFKKRSENTEDSNTKVADETLKELGIEDELQNIIEQVYKISSLALNNVRLKYCNKSEPEVPKLRIGINAEKNNADLLGIVEIVTNYARNMVERAVANLTQFCQESGTIEGYQRARCSWHESNRCLETYKSTKSGPVMYSTQHRPVYFQSTKHDSRDLPKPFINLRSDNGNNETEAIRRRKRHVTENENAKDDLEVIVVEEAITNKPDLRMGSTISLKIPYSEEERRFQKRRFKVKSKRGKKEWSSSALSTEKERGRMKNHKGKRNKHKKEEDSDTEDYRYEKQGFSNENNSEDEIRQKRYKLQERNSEVESKFKKLNCKPKKIVHGDTEDNSDEVRKKKRQKRIEETEIYQKGKEQKARLKKLKLDSSEVITEKNTATFVATVINISRKNREFYDERKWPDGVVRYIIKEDPAYDIADMRDRLAEVNNILKKKTCVRLQEITEENAEGYSDYLELDTSPDYVTGRVGGRQVFGCLELFQGDQHRQHAAMMVMAMLGFYFEVARHDRDKYIRVHLRHVRPDKLHHFEKIREDATFPLPYDYSSATHPAWQFWRKIGKTGISTVATFKQQDPDGSVMKSLGQNEDLLSDLDLMKINTVYGINCFRNARGEKGVSGKAKAREGKEESRDEDVSSRWGDQSQE
ncbi:uncharacterized protein LOC113520895 isoform X2 [Galleria mellonella]|uniref:Metalloendopeptidase n=1 Tax=Galleria mellonella TaxID=7137 RepID=A0ABM3MAI2_GALME|nr:uncharacterized protein LOC113520895 isoform X2 [Galleria mellonella]